MRIQAPVRRTLGGLRATIALLTLAALGPGAATAGEPSPAYRESLRRTVELRRARRATVPAPATAPVGRIEGYPMPPALIIRQTRERHDEIGALLDVLRYGGR